VGEGVEGATGSHVALLSRDMGAFRPSTRGPAAQEPCPGRRQQGTMDGMTKGQQLLEEFRRQRRAGDPRITPEGREILLRITTGDLADEFADSLAAASEADPALSGQLDPDSQPD
jgi:hypothetical protein